MNREAELRAKLRAKMGDVFPHRGQQLYADFIGLLEAIETLYSEELLTVKPEDLRYKQGAAAQCRLLRNALTSTREDVIDVPKV